MAQKIALIGASSKTGQAILRLLDKNSMFETYAFSRNEDLGKVFNFKEQIKLTPLEFKDFKKIIYSIEPDIIINTAGMSGFAECEQNKVLCNDVNARLVENLARVAKILGSKIIQVSTDKIFGGNEGPYDESARPDPSSYFGKTKLAAENHIISAGENFAIIRVSELFGFTAFDKYNIIDYIVANSGKGKKMFFAEDYFFNPIFTDDIARIIFKIINKNSTGIFHAGNRDLISMFEFADMIAEVFYCDRGLIAPKNGDENDFTGHYGVITLKTETALGIKLPENRDSLLFYRNSESRHNYIK